ncbi:Fic family protein [Sphingomonas sp. IBVSS2]|uniref:Fic family protein n=1 Tax=Sphingomonas sp. IBVSS2 TaxID=1985172 RepID=UPI0011819AD4|nr:Fic family protein [Sphingomonas sp. IBVSS2]
MDGEKVIDTLLRLKFPSLEGISNFTVLSAALEAVVIQLQPTDADAMQRLMASYPHTPDERIAALAGLHDELEPHVLGAAPAERAEEARRRTRLEFDIYRAFLRANPDISYRDPARFVRDTIEVHRRCRAGANAFRRSGVRIAAYDKSAATHFPDWRLCDSLMAELAQFVGMHIDKWPATCAMVTYGGIIHAHPFLDGNGRTARIMHNLVLHSAGCRHFLPIGLVASRTGNSLVVKLRRLVLGNDWSSLQRFLHDSYKLSQEWQTGSTEHPPASGGARSS